MGKITQFCMYCRAEFDYQDQLKGFTHCPYDGTKLQDIKIKVPKVTNGD